MECVWIEPWMGAGRPVLIQSNRSQHAGMEYCKRLLNGLILYASESHRDRYLKYKTKLPKIFGVQNDTGDDSEENYLVSLGWSIQSIRWEYCKWPPFISEFGALIKARRAVIDVARADKAINDN